MYFFSLLGDNILSFVIKSTQEVMQEIAARVKAIRLEQNLSQEG